MIGANMLTLIDYNCNSEVMFNCFPWRQMLEVSLLGGFDKQYVERFVNQLHLGL